MSDLADKKCIPCEGGIPSFNLEEIHKYLKKVDGWDVETENKKDYFITKHFKFNQTSLQQLGNDYLDQQVF